MERHFMSAIAWFFMVNDGKTKGIIDTIGDQRARTILAAINKEPQSVKELAKALDFSLATVYRRTELLEDHDLIKNHTIIGDDGNHYKMYKCNFDSAVISLEDDAYNVRVFRQDNFPDKFAQFWNEIRPR